MNVLSLYSNIPHQPGTKAINYLLDGMNFILTNDTFCSNSKHYRQTKGMAMGTKFAPVYATLVIGYIEASLYDKINVKYGIQLTNEFVKS